MNIVIIHLNPFFLPFFLLMQTIDPDSSPWCLWAWISVSLQLWAGLILSLRKEIFGSLTQGHCNSPQLWFITYPFVFVSLVLLLPHGAGLFLSWSASCLVPSIWKNSLNICWKKDWISDRWLNSRSEQTAVLRVMGKAPSLWALWEAPLTTCKGMVEVSGSWQQSEVGRI